MPVKIRLQRKGKKRNPFYHIVIADSRAPRDGRFIEKIGTYNPMTKPATIDIDRTAAYEWLMKGAQPTDTVRAILRFKGVTYMKHLLRGVKKGAITQEEADSKLNAWIEAKEAKVAKRRADAEAELVAAQAKLAGLDLPFKAAEKTVPKVEVKQEEAPAPEEAPAAEAASEEE